MTIGQIVHFVRPQSQLGEPIMAAIVTGQRNETTATLFVIESSGEATFAVQADYDNTWQPGTFHYVDDPRPGEDTTDPSLDVPPSLHPPAVEG